MLYNEAQIFMQKRLLVLMSAALLFCGKMYGQIDHSEFTSLYRMQNAVTVSDENNGRHYWVGTDALHYVFVTDLDHTIPYPSPVNSNARAFPISNFDIIMLRGGFVDNKNDIIVYGYCIDSSGVRNGIVIKVTMQNNTPVSVTYNTYNNDPIVDGCWNWSNIDNIILYSFVTEKGTLVRLKYNLDQYGQQGLKLQYPNTPDQNYDIAHICTVSWDDQNQCYVFSGNVSNIHDNKYYNVIGFIPDAQTLDPSNATVYVLQAGNFTFSEYTNSHVLAGNGYAYLVQDYRTNVTDGFWVTKINYMTGQIAYTNAYLLQSPKISLNDIALNDSHLFILGHHNGYDTVNYQKRFLMQIKLDSPTNYIIKYMEDVNLTAMVPYYNFYDIVTQYYLCNIHLDYASETVWTSGAVPGSAYLVEAFNLYNTTCDADMTASVENVNYSMTYLDFMNQPDINFQGSTDITESIAYTLIQKPICVSGYASPSASPVSGEWNNDSEHYSDKSMPTTGNISVKNDGMFICNGFSGSIGYKIFDMSGRLIDEGITHNGVDNMAKINASGLYMLQTVDENLQRVNIKIFISK
jgi:hypothetical protein